MTNHGVFDNTLFVSMIIGVEERGAKSTVVRFIGVLQENRHENGRISDQIGGTHSERLAAGSCCVAFLKS